MRRGSEVITILYFFKYFLGVEARYCNFSNRKITNQSISNDAMLTIVRAAFTLKLKIGVNL